MDYFTDVLITFLGLGKFQLHCCLWRVRKLLDFIKNILVCVPKINQGIMGLEQRVWVINDKKKYFCVNYSIINNVSKTSKQNIFFFLAER